MTSENPQDPQVQGNWISIILRLVKNKYVRSVFIILLLVFAVLQISKNYHDLALLVTNFEINFSFLFLAFLLTGLASIMGIISWGLIMRGMGYKVKWLKISQIQVYSSLAKYIPGFIWQVAGKTYMSREAGIPSGMAAIGFGLEVTLTLIAGIFIFFFVAPYSSSIESFQTYKNIPWIAISIFFFFLLICIPILFKYVFRRLFQKHNVWVSVLWWYFTVGLIFGGWFLLSAACQLSILALGVSKLSFVESALTTSGSYVAGLVFFFAPNGIVVRETILVMLLPHVIDTSLGILLSIILRIETISAELFIGLFILIVSLISKVLGDKNY